MKKVYCIIFDYQGHNEQLEEIYEEEETLYTVKAGDTIFMGNNE